MNKKLLIGIGNEGRQDDGLGWAFLDQLPTIIKDDYDIEYRYQLQVEDAELIGNYQKVYFIDADVRNFEKGYHLEKTQAKDQGSYTSHELSTESIVSLCNNMYEAFPDCYNLSISGYSFELAIGMTEKAKENLAHLLQNIKTILNN